jgi:two-component system nitrogen regulation sensor histidine kinase GlnL
MASLYAPRREEAPFNASQGADAGKLLDALPHPVLSVRLDGSIADANVAAETFFGMSRGSMRQQNLAQLVAPGSPLLDFVEQVKASGAAFNSYRVELGLSKSGADQLVDIFVTP